MKVSATSRKGIFLLAILFAGMGVWLLCISFQPLEPHYQEPQYEGKKLTDWAKEVDQGAFFGHPLFPKNQREQSELATAAIRHIGTNALPVAVKLCGAKDSWLKTKVGEWIRQYNYDAVNRNMGLPKDQWRSPFPIRVTPAWDQHYYGANIIWALGPAAEPAIPDLIELLQNPDVEIAEDVMKVLPGAGTNAIPPLIHLLSSPDQETRLRAAITLGNFFMPKRSSAESGDSLIVTGSNDFRSQAGAAVPVLLQCLEDGKDNIVTQIRALRALGLIHEEATVAVPVLIQHVETETNWLLQLNCLRTLGGFGTNARVAVPVLLHQLESNPNPPYYPVRRQMVAALAQIDLEAAKPYLIQDKTNSTNVGTIRDDFGLFRKTNSGIIK